MGGQQDDERIIVKESVIDAPDYTQGERKWKQSTITIDGIKRSDDGLYECQAENEGGRFYKSGHIQVELAPICLKTQNLTCFVCTHQLIS